jgi:hypothetical protein
MLAFKSILAVAVGVSFSLCSSVSAQTFITESFTWSTTDGSGYSLSGSFSYDSSLSGTIQASQLQSLSGDLTGPASLSYHFDDIVGGAVPGGIIAPVVFDYNSSSRQVSSDTLSIGNLGEGHFWLTHTISGVSVLDGSTLDTLGNGGDLSVTPVPEPSVLASVGGIILLAWASLRRLKS